MSAKTMIPVLSAVALLTATAFTAPALEAQTVSRTYSRSMGNSYLGGKVYANGKVSVKESGSYAKIESKFVVGAAILFLKKRPEIAEIIAQGTSKGRPSAPANAATFKFDLVGKRLLNKKFTNGATIRRYTKTLKVFPRDIRLRYPVGPATITVKGNVGGSASAACKFSFGLGEVGARIDGDGKAWAFGKADVAAGVPGFKVGVNATAKFAHQTLNLNAGGSQRRGISGSMRYTIRAVILELKGYVKVLWKKWTRTLAKWKSRQYSRTMFRL